MSGTTVLDAGVLIGFVQRRDARHDDAVSALSRLAATRNDLVLSTVTYAELMVGAIKRGSRAVEHIMAVLDGLPRLRLVAPEREIALAAAFVRARAPRLSLADAIIVATAEAIGADRILTTDRAFESVSGAVQLSDFVARPQRRRRR